MKKTALLLMAFALLPLAIAETLSYSLVMDYDGGALSLRNALLIKASPPAASQGGEYTARIISFRDEVLYETSFTVSLEPFYSIPLSKETAKTSQRASKSTIDLLLPYYANAKKIQIVKDNNSLLEIEVSKFSGCNEDGICDGSESLGTCKTDCTCGDGICGSNEDYMGCSTDCPSGQGDGVCDRVSEGLCDPDCKAKQDIDCTAKSGAKEIFILGAIIVLAIGIGYYVFTARRKAK